MKSMKKLLGIILSLSLVLGMIIPGMNTKAEGAEQFDFSTIDGISVSFSGELLEGNVELCPDMGSNSEPYMGYNLGNLQPIVTVFYNNGTEAEIYQGWHEVNVSIPNKYGDTLVFKTNQDVTSWMAGSNKVEVFFKGNTNVKCETNVVVKANPITSFGVVATKPLYEGNKTLPVYTEPGISSPSYFKYDVRQADLQFTVLLKDGTEETCSYYELQDRFGYTCNLDSDYIQTDSNEWGIGKHTVTASFMGQICEFEVEIVEHPVKSIEGIYHGIVVEGTEVVLDSGYVEYIFTFADGSKESCGAYEYVLGQQIAPQLTLEGLENETWNAGEHYATGEIFGKKFQVKVDVLSLDETPIKSISVVATKDLVAEWHAVGESGREYLDVAASMPKVEITYQDDTKEVLYYASLANKYEGVIPKLNMPNNALDGTGKRTATLEFYGHRDEFDVNVIENPIEKVSAVTTKPIIANWRQYPSLTLDGGMVLTVEYKDGTKVTGSPEEMLNIFYDYPTDYTYGHEFVIGTNVAEVEFLGAFFDVEFELVEDPNPIVDLEVKVKEGAVLYESTNTTGEAWYEYGHILDVTLTFKDGSTLTGTVEEVNQKLEDINIREVYPEPVEMTGVGEYTATVWYENIAKEVTIKIVENPYSKATISSDNGFTIVLEKANGEKVTHIAKSFSPTGAMGYSENMFGYVVTDKETLPVEINFAGGRKADYSSISSMYINGIKSNGLKSCDWIEQQLLVKMYGDVPETSVNHSTEELVSLVLTEADYAMGREGEVSATFVISEKEKVSSEEQQLLDKATATLEDYKEGVVVDLTLYKEYPIGGGMESVTEKVPEPNGKLSITMAVPEEILASGTNPENIKMVRIHNGETTVLPCTYDKESKTITFETDKFSTYSMVYEVADSGADGGVGDGTGNGTGTGNADGTGTSSSASTPSGNKAPNTGDTNAVMGYSIMCIVALAAIVVMKRRNSFAK